MKKLISVSLILLSAGVLAACGNASSDSSESSSSVTKSTKVAKGSDTKKESSSSSESKKDDSKTIKYNDENLKIVSETDHDVQWSDSSWAGTNVSVDKARIIKVDKFKDSGDGKEYEGIILVHFNIQAGRDISIYPAQATLITSDGQQEDADMYNSDQFDGDIASGVKKDGWVAFSIPTMTDTKSLTTLRLKWTGNYETDDMNDDNAYKDYDITITLN